MMAVYAPKCGGVWLFHKTEPTTQRVYLENGLKVEHCSSNKQH